MSHQKTVCVSIVNLDVVRIGVRVRVRARMTKQRSRRQQFNEQGPRQTTTTKVCR